MDKNIEIKNPIGMNTEALKAYATEIGVSFTDDVKYNDLRTAVIAKNKELKGDDMNTGGSDENAGGGNTGDAGDKPKGVLYYWIKYPVYIDDEKRLGAGLYRVNEKFSRLSYSSDAYEVFEGEIPERTLIKIAKTRGINYNDTEEINVEELYEKLLNPVKFK